jgi:TonB family protein
MLALLMTALPLFAAVAPPTITPAEAAKHVGEEVVVQGTIDQIATTVNLTTHINMGGRYPKHVFTATILRAKQALFTGVKSYEGKPAEVQGVVRLYRGKPEIMLNDASQLRLVGTAAAPPAPAPAAARIGEDSGSRITGLRFDPQGADFAAWVEHFKGAVNQQWRVPDAASSGAVGGNVDFEFVVERDGSLSAIRMLKSSGTTSLDRAAAQALANSRCLPLPDGYPAQNAMMQVSFAYGAGLK